MKYFIIDLSRKEVIGSRDSITEAKNNLQYQSKKTYYITKADSPELALKNI